ncbi:MAG: fumarylacetoacetate hydrolase family protein [Leptospirales bacterium]|nr:fumarylacetoacetate hydrolase family protein [Leptospirales bacterium]
MSARVMHFQAGQSKGWAYVEGERLLLTSAQSIHDFLGPASRRPAATGETLQLAEVRPLSPLSYPSAVLCQGENYAAHIEEAGGNVRKSFNTLFVKASSSLAPAQGEVRTPTGVQLLDYEAELALILRRDVSAAARITRENLLDYVAGVTLANDISARDIQVPQVQWFKGKSFRGFCPLGPWVTLLDDGEVNSLYQCEFWLSVNGQERQRGAVAQMLFKPEETLMELSALMDLHAGDVLLTGTPAGVALKAPSAALRKVAGLLFSEEKQMQVFVRGQLRLPAYLKAGDRIEARLQSSDGVIDSGLMDLSIA